MLKPMRNPHAVPKLEPTLLLAMSKPVLRKPSLLPLLIDMPDHVKRISLRRLSTACHVLRRAGLFWAQAGDPDTAVDCSKQAALIDKTVQNIRKSIRDKKMVMRMMRISRSKAC